MLSPSEEAASRLFFYWQVENRLMLAVCHYAKIRSLDLCRLLNPINCGEIKHERCKVSWEEKMVKFTEIAVFIAPAFCPKTCI